jgi:hypothetical protein
VIFSLTATTSHRDANLLRLATLRLWAQRAGCLVGLTDV